MIPARASTTTISTTATNNNNINKEARLASHHGSTPSRIHASRPVNPPVAAFHAPPHYVRPGIAPLVNGHGNMIERHSSSDPGSRTATVMGGSTTFDNTAAAPTASVAAGTSEIRSRSSNFTSALSSSSSISSSSATTSSSSSYTTTSSMSSLPSISRTSSCSSRTSSISSSTSSIVRAIDFAYCLPSPGLFDGDVNRRGRSSPSISMSTSSTASMDSSRPSSGPLPSRSSSSVSSSYAGSRSSASSRRTSSSVYSNTSSPSLASRFRDWAINEGPLHSTTDQFSSHTSRKPSLHCVKPISQYTLASSPTSSGEIFSPLTAVPPLPASVYPAGMLENMEEDCAVIDDIEGLVCFQPGW